MRWFVYKEVLTCTYIYFKYTFITASIFHLYSSYVLFHRKHEHDVLCENNSTTSVGNSVGNQACFCYQS